MHGRLFWVWPLIHGFYVLRGDHPLCEVAVPIPSNPIQRFASAFLLAALGAAQPALGAEAVQPARFSGQATATTPTPTSSDGRFQLDAALSASTQPSDDGRFSLSAKLKPDPKSVTGTCAPLGDSIFRNGFE